MNFCKSLKIIQVILLLLLVSTISVLCVEKAYADERSEILTLINKERTDRSLEPLRIDEELEQAADIRSEEITIVMGHTRPCGNRFSSVSPSAKGENLAGGQRTPEEVVTAWMNSAGHRKNILNPKFTTIGISYKQTNDGYKHFWVNLFGVKKTKKIYLEKVNGVKAESEKTKITLKWNKQSSEKATGFEIFKYNPKTKKYKLMIKTSKPTTNGLMINGLHSSTTYTYKIRSYKIYNEKTYFTPFSGITVRTKKA